MPLSLKILVTEDEADMQEFYAAFLPRLGYTLVGMTDQGAKAIEMCAELKPDLLIADIMLPDMDGIETARIAAHQRPMPVILVSAYVDDDLRARALDDHVMAYLIKPIDENDLRSAIPVAADQFRRFLALKGETELLRKSLQDRKVLERAKGIIMTRAGITEDEATHRLQKLALEHRQTLVQTAQGIIDAQLALTPPAPPTPPPAQANRRGRVPRKKK